jgi:hypothetical protein
MLPETFMAMLHFACGMIAWRAAGLLEQVLIPTPGCRLFDIP